MKKVLLLTLTMITTWGLIAQDSDPLPITYGAGGNVWIGIENADDSDTPVPGLVSESSYNLQAFYKFPSKKESSFIPFFKATQRIVSLRAVRFRSLASDSESEWLENIQAIGLVYGNRYFFKESFEGFNVGWYLGVASSYHEGYEWGDFYGPDYFEENLILFLNGIEFNYHFEYKWFFAEPTFTVFVNSSNFDIAYYPTIVLGFQLTKDYNK